MINTGVLVRGAALAAMAGGVLRCISAFSPPLGAMGQEALWTLIDVLLTLGLIGVYCTRAERLGLLGLAAFVTAMAALSFIGGPDADPFGFSTYEQGAAVLAIAMAGLALAWLRAGERPLLAPLCWLGALAIGGLLGAVAPALAGWGFASAGALFGAGFVFAGWSLLTRKS